MRCFRPPVLIQKCKVIFWAFSHNDEQISLWWGLLGAEDGGLRVQRVQHGTCCRGVTHAVSWGTSRYCQQRVCLCHKTWNKTINSLNKGSCVLLMVFLICVSFSFTQVLQDGFPFVSDFSACISHGFDVDTQATIALQDRVKKKIFFLFCLGLLWST